MAPTEKEQFLDAYRTESATTAKILRAYPKDKGDLKPHDKCRTARDLAWVFVIEQMLTRKAITKGLDWSKPSEMPPAPASWDEIVATFEKAVDETADAVSGISDDRLSSATVPFPTGPGEMGDWPMLRFMWMVLHDQIHHRGQLSVYLRMANGKLPSIYGPTADEPWM